MRYVGGREKVGRESERKWGENQRDSQRVSQRESRGKQRDNIVTFLKLSLGVFLQRILA